MFGFGMQPPSSLGPTRWQVNQEQTDSGDTMLEEKFEAATREGHGTGDITVVAARHMRLDAFDSDTQEPVTPRRALRVVSD